MGLTRPPHPLLPAPSPARAWWDVPRREASVATYLDRLDDGSDISIKELARQLPYGQCAIGTALDNLSLAGYLRRVRRPVTVDGGPRWVWHTFFSRTARDDAWWESFIAGKAPVSGAAEPSAADPPADGLPVAEPSRAARSAAYDVLARLGRIDARLTRGRAG